MLLTPKELSDLLKELNPQQMKFCELYVLRSLSGGKAAKRAGYADGSRFVQASRLLSNDKVIKYVDHLKAVQAVEAEVTAARLVNELKPIAFQDLGDYVESTDFGVRLADLKDVDTRAIKKITVKKDANDPDGGDLITIELHDKLKATELIGKHIGAFTDKVDITSKGKKIKDKTTNKIFINHRRKGEQLKENENENDG